LSQLPVGLILIEICTHLIYKLDWIDNLSINLVLLLANTGLKLKFTNMNVVITGASKGIGKAIAMKFAKEGANLAICSRNMTELEKTKAELESINKSIQVVAISCDVRNKIEVIDFAKQVLSHFSRIDILVNNAGIFLPGEIQSEADGCLETLIETNLYSAYHITRAILPAMKLNDLSKGVRGYIYNICSVAGLQAYENGGSYSISKFALVGFSKNLRSELMPYSIKVITVNPGATMSDSWVGSGVDENRIMQASDIADCVWHIQTLSPQAVVEEITLRPMLGDL